MMRIFLATSFSYLILSVTATPVGAIVPDDPGTGDVAFTIDATGSSLPISPLIYSINGDLRPSGVQGIRLGGNRWTGYNWETNNSNAGEDFFNYNDTFLVNGQPNTPPGQAVLPTLQENLALGGATTVTVPIAGYVSADANLEVFPGETAPSSRWYEVEAKKSTIYPGQSLSLTPNENDNYVFTDEYVNWVEANRQSNQEVLYSLDNEPGLWDNTHPRLFGTTNPTFAEYASRAIAHSSAIKDVAPLAKVLGGVTFGWDAMESLNGAPDFDQQVPEPRPADGLHFNRWLLETMAAEELQQGRTLMDVLDLHWYPEAQGGGVRIVGQPALTLELIEARVQAPRSLWDPTYIEDSYITQFKTFDYSGAGNHEGVELLNRVQADIDELRPGTLISVSEYNYGGGNHISGGIAQADVLGIFGREGVYNAAWWPFASVANSQYVAAGFEMFTDFDGTGGRFGDLSLTADTDDIAQSSVYASHSTENPNEMIVVAINRTDSPLDAAIQVTDGQQYNSAEIFQLTDASAAPVSLGAVPINLVNAFLYEMPAYSVSTLRLTTDLLADFDDDGTVDNDDLSKWETDYGGPGSDADQDGISSGLDFLFWQQQFGRSEPVAAIATTVPEPKAWLMASLGLLCICYRDGEASNRRESGI